MQSISKNAIFNMLNKGISVLFPLLTISYISRVLGPKGIGVVSSAQNFTIYFTSCAALGIPSYGIRAISKTRNNQHEVSKTFTELFIINCFSTFICFILYYIFWNFSRSSYPNIDLMIIFSSLILFNFCNIEWVYQGFEEYKYITIRSLIVKILSIILMFIFVHEDCHLNRYALIICFGTVGNYLLNIINLKKYVWFDFSNLNLFKHLSPIFTFFASVIAIEIYSLLDVTMLTSLTNPECVGYYSNSTKIIKTIASTLTGFSAVLMPRLSYYFSNDFQDQANDVCEKFLNVTLFFSLPSFVGISILSSQIVLLLFGNAFEPASLTIKILAPLILFMPLSGGVFCQVLLSYGKEKIYFLCVALGTIINATLNYLLIPVMMQNGAALASVFSECTVSISMMIASSYIIRFNFKNNTFNSIVLSTIIMGLMVLLVKSIFYNIKSLFCLILLEVIIGVFVYIYCLILFKNKIVIDMIKKNKSKFLKY